MSSVSECQVILNFLRTQNVFPLAKDAVQKGLGLPSPKKKMVSFVAHLLETFGQQHADKIKTRLNGDAAFEFDRIHRAYYEIQNKLQIPFTADEFPCASEVIERIRSETRSAEQCYITMRRRSYEILTFPQQILTHPDYDPQVFAEIEAVRLRAFEHLNESLSPIKADDEKAEIALEAPRLKELTAEEELALTKLYFKDGALVYNKKIVTFSDLIENWQHTHVRNPTLREQLLSRLTVKHWIDDVPKKPMVQFLKPSDADSFKNYLVQCSVDALQRNLDVPFSLSLEKVFFKSFQDESVRSDVSYFTADLARFYEMDFGALNRPSAPLLKTIQLFLFFVRTRGVRQQDQASFLDLLMHRNPKWNGENFPGFKDRRWAQPPTGEEDLLFFNARNAFESALSTKQQRPFSLTNPSEVDQAIFKQSESWKLFFSYYSLEFVQKQLGVSFSPSLRADFFEAFQNEEVRSEIFSLCCDLPNFYEMDLEKQNSPRARLLKPIQLFLFLIRTMKVRAEDQGSLLDMLIHSGEYKTDAFEGYKQRSWSHAPVDVENPDFYESWKEMESLLSVSGKNRVSFSNPNPKDQELMKQPCCWMLLNFFWRNERRRLFFETITTLAKHPSFSITMAQIYRFCKEADLWLKQHLGSLFCQNYFGVIEVLQRNGIEVQRAETIFFDPPVEDLSAPQALLSLGHAPRRAVLFVGYMRPYSFPPNEAYFKLLRQYAFRPFDQLFELIKDAPAIGAKKIDEGFLWEVLSYKHRSFTPDGSPVAPEVRAQAREITTKLQEKYRFSDTKIFFIYLEIIRLVIAGKKQELGLVSQLICDLETFCPFLHSKDLYFLFRYRPQIELKQVHALFDLRAKWARSESQISRFIIDMNKFQEIINPVCEFVDAISAACLTREREEFVQTFRQSILSAFFPPLQPLTDSFRISNLTVENGIRWRAAELRTHEGQLKSVLGNSSLKVFFHRKIYRDTPTLFISFFDVKKNTAHSAFIPLRVSAAEINPENRRVAFYNLQFRLSQQVLKEEADANPASEEETPEAWIPCYLGVREEIDGNSEEIEQGNLTIASINQLWDFMRRVKVTYRTLFLSATGDRPLPPFSSYSPFHVAAMGHIFPSHPRGSLIPKSLLEIEPRPENFLSDASEEFVRACADRGLFTDSTRRPEFLNLSLRINGLEVPILYHVQTAEQLITSDDRFQQGWRKHGNAPEEENIQGSYVTLSTADGKFDMLLRYPPEVLKERALFQKYFDYHTLLLKSAVYHEIQM